MEALLTAGQRDKAVYALHDISVELFGDPRKLNYADLDSVQTILSSRGLQIAPIPKPAPLVFAEPAPAQASILTSPSKISMNDMNWIETVIQKYRHAVQNNITGYNFKNEMVGRLLHIFCSQHGIPFKR